MLEQSNFLSNFHQKALDSKVEVIYDLVKQEAFIDQPDFLRPRFNERQLNRITSENKGLTYSDPEFKNFFPYEFDPQGNHFGEEASPHGDINKTPFYSISEDGNEISLHNPMKGNWELAVEGIEFEPFTENSINFPNKAMLNYRDNLNLPDSYFPEEIVDYQRGNTVLEEYKIYQNDVLENEALNNEESYEDDQDISSLFHDSGNIQIEQGLTY